MQNMRILLFSTAQCGGRQIRYSYLIEELALEIETYGIEVELEGERVRLPNLTSSQRRITELLDRMARCAVTPVSARDVAEDWLLE